MKKTAKSATYKLTAAEKNRVEKALSLHDEVKKHYWVRGMTFGGESATGVIYNWTEFQNIQISRDEAGKFVTTREPLTLQQAAEKVLANMEIEREGGADIEVTDEGLIGFLKMIASIK